MSAASPAEPEPLPRLLTVLERGQAEIDRTFAAAGERLSAGLASFEALDARLRALSAELLGGQVEQTRTALLSVVEELRAFGIGLPDEFMILQDVAGHGEAASRSLERLTDHIRLIAAVARSARIEAAQLASSRQDHSFFDEIGILVARARQTIDGCAGEHARLMGLLSTVITSQKGFATLYGPMLAALADQLERTLAGFEACRRGNAATAAAAARQSREIANAVGNAIIALQCGDSTRQRLEHAVAALGLLPGNAETSAGADEAAAIGAALRHLVAAQLHGAAQAMAQDVQEIDETLRLLSRGFVQGEGKAGADAMSPDTFLAALESELAEAAALLARCNAAFVAVDGVTGALKAFVEQFRQTAIALSEIVRSIVLIGLNSGLHAARLGSEGRGLVVIAHEMKAVADCIVADAAALSPVFELMQSSVAELRAGGRGDVQRLAGLDRAMAGSLAAMKGSGARFGETMGALAADGQALSVMMDQACHSFAAACAAGEEIAAAAERLKAGVTTTVSDTPGLRDVLDRAVWPSYTMAAERVLHRSVLEALGIGEAAAA